MPIELPIHEKGAGASPARSAARSNGAFRLLAWVLVLVAYPALRLALLMRSDSPSNKSSSTTSLPTLYELPDINTLPRGEIAWHDCPADQNSTLFDCGRLIAPLDHLNPETEKRNAGIYLLRYKARQSFDGPETPRDQVLGTILLNPGGPGGSGVGFISRRKPETGNRTLAEIFDRTITLGRYDYLSFDPRGVGLTYPRASCWPSQADECLNEAISSVFNQYHAIKGGEKAQAGMILADLELQGQLCSNKPDMADTLRYVSTTAVARDMRMIYKAVGDKALNYWGFSYGTVLGSTYADMFPKEVSRVVVDGVVNVTDYHRGKWASTAVDTDGVYYGFTNECAQAGSACALNRGLHKAGGGKSKKEKHNAVLEKLSDLFDKLAVEPIAVANATHPGLLTWAHLKGALFHALYTPVSWNTLAEEIQQIIEGNPLPFFEKYGPAPCKAGPALDTQANAAIACGDLAKDVKTKPTVDDYLHFIKQHERKSKYFGGSFVQQVACKGDWHIHTNEPWRGDFTSKTSHPLLMIGNSFDPVTPHVNAEYMANLFPGASYLLRKGYGHCSLSQKSKCIEKLVGDYFIHGSVPKFGHVCDVDTDEQPLFHGQKQTSAAFALMAATEDIGPISRGERV